MKNGPGGLTVSGRNRSTLIFYFQFSNKTQTFESPGIHSLPLFLRQLQLGTGQASVVSEDWARYSLAGSWLHEQTAITIHLLYAAWSNASAVHACRMEPEFTLCNNSWTHYKHQPKFFPNFSSAAPSDNGSCRIYMPSRTSLSVSV